MSINCRLLKKAIIEGKLAHLIIFHGSGAEERYRAVLELALMLNCKEDRENPCETCSACKKIISGNHPDIHIVKPQKTSIGIEQILFLQSKIFRQSYESKYRVCLLQEANKLTLPAANALLKIAEEPPDNTLIILSTANYQGIISTLQSRAQAVYFPPPEAQDWKGDFEVYRLSDGDPDLARAIQQKGIEVVKGWIDHYFKTIEINDILKIFGLFPMEREDSLLLLQVLAVTIKKMITESQVSPYILEEVRHSLEMVRRQVNHRLALEVLAIKHIKLGGTKIG